MEIKKARNCAMNFALQRFSFVIQNMRESLKKCMSNKSIFVNVIFLCFIFLLSSTAYANGIDDAGNRIYYKLVNVGKWVIIVKGGIDIIQNVISGDMQSAKKMFMGYLFAYGVLFALPWCMDEVENVFKGM